MSHAATHWLATVSPAEMTHGEFRVLFHLCDCHNASMGCFPKQAYLRDHTGLSNGGLNNALNELERKGLLQREQSRDERTNRQKPTRYILGFELPEAKEPPPLSGDGAGSTFDAVPSPLSGGSVSTGVESYTKEEPVKEPVSEPCGPQTPDLQYGFLEEFAAAFPRIGSLEKTEAALRQAIADGAKPEVILAGAKAYAVEQKGNAPHYIAYSENWVAQARWVQFEQPAADPAAAEKITERWVKAIKTGHQALARHCSVATAHEMIARMLVTEDECRAAGISL